VLTVSDSVAGGLKQDGSGPAVRERLEACGFDVTLMHVVPDSKEQIASWLRQVADDDRVEAVFTTGGTGVASRDVTPEATQAVIEKEIPGIAERMRSEGAKHTPLAALSRGVAGVRGRVVIVNLPGSPRGAVQSLDAIVELVPHVVKLLHGETSHDGVEPTVSLSTSHKRTDS
jgi:molybdenum cofactor synthesis domain-containing protein